MVVERRRKLRTLVEEACYRMVEAGGVLVVGEMDMFVYGLVEKNVFVVVVGYAIVVAV